MRLPGPVPALPHPPLCSVPACPACPQPNHVPADATSFQQLHHHLEASFPLVYNKLEHERVNEYSILFKWTGSDPALKPLL